MEADRYSMDSSSRSSNHDTRSGSTASSSIKPNSNDIAWEWGECRDPTAKNVVTCKICDKTITGGITRLKEHLAWKGGNVSKCNDVPNEVKMKCMEALMSTQKKKFEKVRVAQILNEDTLLAGEIGVDDDIEEGAKGQQTISGNVSGSGGIFIGSKKRKFVPISNFRGPIDTMLRTDFNKLKQVDLDKNNPHKEKLKHESWLAIADWAYEVGLPFNVVRTPKFQHMINTIGQYGKGMPAPSYYNMRVTLLRDMLKETKLFVNSFRRHWEAYGCSIMSDFWTDEKGRSLINFLVNCPNGTIFLKSIDASEHVKDSALIVGMMNEVIEDVGEEHIIQFVTDNGSNFKAAGAELERQHPMLFWTPCAAHCINLILQDLGNKVDKIRKVLPEARAVVVYIYNHGRVLSMMRKLTKNKELHRSCVTRFATSFYTLQSIWENRFHVQTLFVSEQWRMSYFSTKAEGKRIENIVAQNEFWENVHLACKVLAPLVDVLRLVDSEEKPCMGYLYEAMDRAKEQIEKNIAGNDRLLNQVWRIIDVRWNEQLHHPLHAAAFYLNPSIYYKNTMNQMEGNKEIKVGLMTCAARLVPNEDEYVQMGDDLTMYRDELGLFGTQAAKKTRDQISPTQWWFNYGSEAPILQRLATRILSLTCSASPCERNWSTFDNLHSKRRNCLLQSKLNDLVFIQYNKKLERRRKERNANIKSTSHDPIVLREVDENDDWLIPTDNELAEFVREGDDLTWTQVRQARGVTNLMPNTRSRMQQSSTTISAQLRDEDEDQREEDDGDIDIDIVDQ